MYIIKKRRRLLGTILALKISLTTKLSIVVNEHGFAMNEIYQHALFMTKINQ